MNNIINRIAVAFALAATLALPTLAQDGKGAKSASKPAMTASKKAKTEKKNPFAADGVVKLKKGEGTVNVNKAGLDELVRVPGIGNSTAERILEIRKENGKFATLEDLTQVKGIGEKKLARMKPFLSI
jgi:comEA protein